MATSSATRLYILRPAQLRKLTFQRILTILTYLIAMLFIFSNTIYLTIFQAESHHVCHGTIILCLAFYVSSKIVVYLFLLERASSIRGLRKLRDPYWIAGIAIIAGGFGTIAVFAFIGPMVVVSSDPSHDCQIGLPIKALIPLLSYDVLLNMGLTILYLAMANTICNRLSWHNSFKLLMQAMPFRNHGPFPNQEAVFELFMAKSVLACLGVVLSTVGNLVALIVLRGHEEAWMCLTFCSADVSWAVLVIHWLTSNVFRHDQATLTACPRARQLAGEYHEMR
ncbi:MAG: hypothetical protein HETSPECPRED_000393 [Heterodermia speciosa]|uniref:Uncharacterized protein n=1 Tax=Heterodermia speciosa TaxID=116794 RepID=A0A8H3EZE5_9LECA|nr:MAG: hypothetical protein HETSPECPRED_000393 [Heterodermia speciosa]